MIGRADIEGSKSNVAVNAWLPQASYLLARSLEQNRAWRKVSPSEMLTYRSIRRSIGNFSDTLRPNRKPGKGYAQGCPGIPWDASMSLASGFEPAYQVSPGMPWYTSRSLAFRPGDGTEYTQVYPGIPRYTLVYLHELGFRLVPP